MSFDFALPIFISLAHKKKEERYLSLSNALKLYLHVFDYQTRIICYKACKACQPIQSHQTRHVADHIMHNTHFTRLTIDNKRKNKILSTIVLRIKSWMWEYKVSKRIYRIRMQNGVHAYKQERIYLMFLSSPSLTSSTPFSLKNRLTGYYNEKQFCSGNRFIVFFFSLSISLTASIFICIFVCLIWFLPHQPSLPTSVPFYFHIRICIYIYIELPDVIPLK